MKRFFNNRTKHTTTALVLIAWLFALISGIANACLPEGAHGVHAHLAADETSPHVHAITNRSVQTGAVEDDVDTSPTVKVLCADACEDRTHAVPKRNAPADQPSLAPFAVFAVAWSAHRPPASTVRFDRATHADPFGIPIRVRYSRLTL